MLIGLDFDNTVVCYDKAIAQLADELFQLPADLPRSKIHLRDYLRSAGRESDWTAFQGELYGPGMAYAEPFTGAEQAMRDLKALGHILCIVSHRSRYPYAGPKYDLHKAARTWVTERLVKKGLFNEKSVYFHETREQKIATIASLGCNLFLDDLPEVLSDHEFPKACKPVLFDVSGVHSKNTFARIQDWAGLMAKVH